MAEVTSSSPEAENRVIVVLGMHRSGTSVITRSLQVMGVELGNKLMPPVEGNNKKGFWEDMDLNALNIEILTSLNLDWHFLTPIQQADVEILRRNGYILRAVDLIRKKAHGSHVFGFKDPRVAKLLPFWKEVFVQSHMKVSYILTIRHPLSVAKSIAKRDGFDFEKSYLLWLEHVLNSLVETAGENRILVDYDRLMHAAEQELMKIANQFQLPISPSELEKFKTEFLDKELQHTFYQLSDLTLDESMPPLVQEVYSQLTGIGTNTAQLEEAAFNDKILQWRDEFLRQKSSLGLIDKLASRINSVSQALEMLSTQLNEVKQQLASNSVQWASTSAQLKKKEETIHSLNATLQEIYGSRAWRLVQRLWSVRRTIAPAGSQREQTLRKAFQILLFPIRKIKGGSQVVQDLTSPEFDKDWYLASYPDVAMANIDPYQHYMQKGRFEGRLGKAPALVSQEGAAGFDPSKQTVLVVSHEATRTGAPVLSFNIIENLRKKYNVVSLLLGAGPIVKHFSDVSSSVVGPMPLRGAPLLAAAVVDQITKLYQLKFAIVNSIESGVVLPALARRFVPAINLVHEFATYTRPKDAFPEAALWSQEMIFSARVTLENALHEHPLLTEHSFHILPQGRCDVPSIDDDLPSLLREEAKVLEKLRPEGSSADMVVVLGAGTVQIRKGVDLFIDCAAKILRSDPETDFRFVWIGHGYDPTKDLGYSVYLADQVQRAGLQEYVFFMENTSNIEAAYRAADILVLSSRLDPLPNVAVDAMIHGMPVVCFEDTTGIADILTAGGFADPCVAPYLDTGDMAAKISAFIQSKSLRQEIGERLKQLALEKFDMVSYTTQLEELGLASQIRISQEQLDTAEIANAGMARMDFFQDQLLRDTLKSQEEAYRYYVRSWASKIRRRKLFPGFHPGIFAEQSGKCADGHDPLAEYLRSGQPDGPWRYDILTQEAATGTIPSGMHIALHIHVYYPDLLPDMLARLSKNRIRPDLFISLTADRPAGEVEKALKNYAGQVVDVQAVPNRGRDVAPFLTTFGPAFVDRYDLVGHLHTKKTANIQDSQMGEVWRLFLLENLLGGKSSMADAILKCMADDPTIGMIFPDDPNVMGWTQNKSYAEELGRQIGIHELPEHFLFPMGTMFWARVNALIPLFERGLDWQDYPSEPLPYDGTVLHALERILPFVVSKQGFRIALTNVPGVTR